LLDLDDDYALRFVSLWSQWRSDPKRCARLHVVLVVQALALPGNLLRQLVRALPAQEHALAEQLFRQWPLNLPGVHRLEFEALHVTLTLAVGPASVMLTRLNLAADAVLLSEAQLAQPSPSRLGWAASLARLSKANSVLLARATTAAWPSWLETSMVFHERAIIRLAKDLKSSEQVSDGLATRQLEPGLTGQLRSAQTFALANDLVETPGVVFFLHARVSPRLRAAAESGVYCPSASAPRHLVVVGGGLAGLHVAQALALRGWRVTVLEASVARAQSQPGHLAAALTPVVSRQDDHYARLSRAGSLRARVRWAQMADDSVTPCGALQLQRTSGRIVDLKTMADELNFPEQFLRFVDAAQASDLAGMALTRGGLYFATACRVQPLALLDRLAQTDGVTCLSAQVSCVERVEHGRGQWRVLDRAGVVLAEATQVVLAAGLATQALLAASHLLEPTSRLAAMYGLRGELTYLDQALLAGGPRCIVSGDGYVLPAVKGQCVLGGSYLNNGDSPKVVVSARQENLERVAQLLSIPLPRTVGVQSLQGWGGQRAVVPDRFPVVGPVLGSSGLWVATGFASRGLTWASLAGDLIAASLTNEPSLLENDIIARINKI
jgi:tRNA 5-methylaminomethyl-2-thiouridine biosynthesis bifunctional protein